MKYAPLLTFLLGAVLTYQGLYSQSLPTGVLVAATFPFNRWEVVIGIATMTILPFLVRDLGRAAAHQSQ